MNRSNRISALWVMGVLLIILAGITIVWIMSLPVVTAKAVSWFGPNEEINKQASPLDPKPVHEWYVCGDLGFGTVPGVPDARQRVKLCHEKGWVLHTYCTQPELPVPEMGTICDRVSEDMYYCGPGLQLIREYRLVDTPGPSPTPTETQIGQITPTETEILLDTPTSTSTQIALPSLTPTGTQIQATTPAPTATSTQAQLTEDAPGSATPTRRVRPGGAGILEQIGLVLLFEVAILIAITVLVFALLRSKPLSRQ